MPNFLEIPALVVKQPLGSFYVVKIKAEKLLKIAFSEPLQYVDESGKLKGSQRTKDEKRLKAIAKYIDSVEMAFLNTIILAANYTPEGKILTSDEDEEKLRWSTIPSEMEGVVKLIVPESLPLAAIIDGQHRLDAFSFTNKETSNEIELVCSIYFDLPSSYQAFLFATINSNQKNVDRSLALEQFGFNVDDEPRKAWTPEKFAVFLSRKLNVDEDDSPFFKHIKVAPLNSNKLFETIEKDEWYVSTATIVDGILSLISSNPKRDRVEMQQKSILWGRDRRMLKSFNDTSPLRNLFINGNDLTIYKTITNFFEQAKKYLWDVKEGNSYITKTVGVQAQFDILKLILKKDTKVIETYNFSKYLIASSNINFNNKFFQASGIGRSRIKNAIALASGLIDYKSIKEDDRNTFAEIIGDSHFRV